MKTNKTKLLSILILTIFSIMKMDFCVASNFVAAATSEAGLTSGTILAGVNCGNDLNDWDNHHFEVSVGDDYGTLNGGLAWNVTGTYGSSGYTPFSFSGDEYSDPDVCLVDDGTSMFAVAVYMATDDNGGSYDCDYILQCFEYDYGVPGFVPCTTIVLYNYGTALASIPLTTDFEINIDGGYDRSNNYFVITWNDADGKYVFAQKGAVDRCAVLSCAAQRVYTSPGLPTDQPGLPDVAINEDSVYFAYLIKIGGTNYIRVTRTGLNTQRGLCSGYGTLFFNIIANYAATTYELTNPRIACPNITTSGYSANEEDFMVVAQETNFSSAWGIFGINYKNGTGFTYTVFYNDGSGSSPEDLSYYANTVPVVTYTEDGYTIVGWILDNLSGNFTSPAVQALYPIALNCNDKGQILSGDYMNVPRDFNTTEFPSLAIAGRNSSLFVRQELFTFPGIGEDLDVKVLGEGSDPLRLARKEETFSVNDFLFKASMCPPEGILNFELYDVFGRRIICNTGNIDQIRMVFNNNFKDVTPGIYVVKISSLEGSFCISGNIYLNN